MAISYTAVEFRGKATPKFSKSCISLTTLWIKV